MTILNNNSAVTKFVSNSVNNATTIVPSGSIAVGNEYNVLIPANGSVEVNYLPDGKYELTCHYDIDFDNFKFDLDNSSSSVKFTKENGKYYITLSSKDITSVGGIIHSSTIDYWRGYTNDKNDTPIYNTSIRKTTDNPFQSGHSVNEDAGSSFQDEKDPNNINNNGYFNNNFQTGN